MIAAALPRPSVNRPPSAPWHPLTAWIPHHDSVAWRLLTRLHATRPTVNAELRLLLPGVTTDQFHTALYRLRRHGYLRRAEPRQHPPAWTITPDGRRALEAGASDLTIRQAQVLLLLSDTPTGLKALGATFAGRYGFLHHTRLHQLLTGLELRVLVSNAPARQWALTDLGAARQPLARARLGLT